MNKETTIETPDDAPVEMSGDWPIVLIGGRRLYPLPWSGVVLLDTGHTFTASTWVKRKLAKKRADKSRRRNRR